MRSEGRSALMATPRLLARAAAMVALALALGASGASLSEYDATCQRKLVWLTGFQSVTLSGARVRYMASNKEYEGYLKAALTSARLHAPSLIPVVVLTGPAQGRSPPAWIAQRGGVAVQHRLSFEPHLAALARQPAYAFTESLWGSWLRVDLPRLLPAVASALARRGLLAATQLDTVLWTDPDVLFRADVTACGLPVPRILSIGPEAGFGLAHNYGVVYFNVSGYSEHFDGLLAAAAAARWEFDHDQALLSQHFGTRVGLLPDALNWKPYWGAPAAAFRPAWLAAPVRILHFHGPKLSVANCMLERMRADARAAAAWAEQERVDVFKACGGREAPNGSPAWMHVLVNLVFGAFDVDQGALYNESASMVATYVAREEA